MGIAGVHVSWEEFMETVGEGLKENDDNII